MFSRSVTALALSALVGAAACTSSPGTPATSAPEPAAAPQATAQPASPAALEQADHATPPPAVATGAPAEPELSPLAASQQIVTPPRPKPGASHGPGFDMPMITNGGVSPVRPADVVRAAHIFVADHPEVARYVPCYCGCGSAGHTGSEDCFIIARDAQGRVTEWEPHGVTCAVCIDVAVAAMRMYNSGASVTAIRAAIEREYKEYADSMTPTPRPPAR